MRGQLNRLETELKKALIKSLPTLLKLTFLSIIGIIEGFKI